MKRSFWNEVPLFRFIPVFIGGILTGIYFPQINLLIAIIISGGLFLCISALHFFSKKFHTFQYRWIFGLFSFILIYFLGLTLSLIHIEANYSNHFKRFQSDQLIGFIDKPLKEKDKTFQTIIKIISVKDSCWVRTTGNCLVYFEKNPLSENLKYGDLIFFNSIPSEVAPPSNPSQFDYKRWLSFNKIYHQAYLSNSSWKLLGHHYGNWLYDFAFSLRDKFLSVFRSYGIEGQDYAVLSALTLGYENDIDQEIIDAYSASGALHVLSVSGLHVGIIYYALNLLLNFLERKRVTRIIKFFAIALFLWFYALITGLSPSVLRSTIMLTVIVIGNTRAAPTNIYNSLAASAMGLLIYNPLYLMQVGFQLSFLAVLGIITLQPLIQNLWSAPNWLLHQIWMLIAVSVAAQTATFPLGLLYFHQFPVYFIFSNLFIIPLTNLIIFSGLALLIFAAFSVVAKPLAIILGALVHFVNTTVLAVEYLPYATIHGISISVIETWFIYLLICLLLLFVFDKLPGYLIGALCSIIILLGIQIKETMITRDRTLMVVYNIPKQSAISFINNTSCVFLSDSSLYTNRSKMLFSIYHDWWNKGIDEKTVTYVQDDTKYLSSDFVSIKNNLIQFNSKNILHLSNTNVLNHLKANPKLDLVILSNNLKLSLSDLLKKVKVSQIIIDSSNSYYKTKRWLKEAEQLKVNCYSVFEKGAFVLNANAKTL
jgi:competence protein ComEC